MANPIPRRILEFENKCRELGDTAKIHEYIESEIRIAENIYHYYFLKSADYSYGAQREYLELHDYIQFLKAVKRPIEIPTEQSKPTKNQSPPTSGKLIRYKKYFDTYKSHTGSGKKSHLEAVRLTIKEHGISEKTLDRAIDSAPYL